MRPFRGIVQVVCPSQQIAPPYPHLHPTSRARAAMAFFGVRA
jgi:hypothetical protein